jgi:hypothetical protein
MTAAAIVALVASGIPQSDSKIQNAFAYLKTAQNPDGGFTYDPQSSYGTASDSSSTAWAVWALNAAGINPLDFSKSGNSPINYLESSQAPEGFFRYQTGSSEDAFSPVTTAYAVIALAGKTLPLYVFTGTAEFEFRIEGKSNTVCSGQAPGPTALDIVKNASTQCGFSYHIQSTSFGPYLDQIGDDKAEGLIGWLYLVNYIAPPKGAADYTLKPGDSIIWYYGDFSWKPARIGLTNTEVAGGASVTATVEYFADNAWTALFEAEVFFGTSNILTDAAGKAVIRAADGYYKIFAEKDGYVRTSSLLLEVGALVENQVNLSVNIEKGQVQASRISFLVTPSSIDFGTLKPGESASKNLTINNSGTVAITVESIVGGDEIFLNNLLLDAISWKNFREHVAAGNAKEVSAALNAPLIYTAQEGNKTAALTFWARGE